MKVKDPVCGMTFEERDAKASSNYEGTIYYFCNEQCKKSFDKNPAEYVAKVTEATPRR